MRYITPVCAAMAATEVRLETFTMPAFKWEYCTRSTSMAILKSWSFIQDPHAVMKLCSPWGVLKCLQLPYTVLAELKKHLTMSLAGATALKQLTNRNMFPFQSCVLQLSKDVFLESLTLEDPPLEIIASVMSSHKLLTKSLLFQMDDWELASNWGETARQGRISRCHGPASVELFKWSIPHHHHEGNPDFSRIEGSATGKHAMSNGWVEMLLDFSEF
jgi:hypothetical protein